MPALDGKAEAEIGGHGFRRPVGRVKSGGIIAKEAVGGHQAVCRRAGGVAFCATAELCRLVVPAAGFSAAGRGVFEATGWSRVKIKEAV